MNEQTAIYLNDNELNKISLALNRLRANSTAMEDECITEILEKVEAARDEILAKVEEKRRRMVCEREAREWAKAAAAA